MNHPVSSLRRKLALAAIALLIALVMLPNVAWLVHDAEISVWFPCGPRRWYCRWQCWPYCLRCWDVGRGWRA